MLLAERLRSFKIEYYISSDEPKSLSIAQLLAEHLHGTPQPVTTDLRLRETSRNAVPYITEIADFKRAIRQTTQ